MLMVGIPRSRQSRPGWRRLARVRGTLDAMIGASPFCQLGYVLDGEPIVVPALCWSDDGQVYLIVSRAGLKNVPRGLDVYLTLRPGEVRSGSAISLPHDSRSAVLSGKAHAVAGAQAKLSLLSAYLERVFRGHWDKTRGPSPEEIRSTVILRLDLDEACVKFGTGTRGEADCGLPPWIGKLRFALRGCNQRA